MAENLPADGRLLNDSEHTHASVAVAAAEDVYAEGASQEVVPGDARAVQGWPSREYVEEGARGKGDGLLLPAHGAMSGTGVVVTLWLRHYLVAESAPAGEDAVIAGEVAPLRWDEGRDAGDELLPCEDQRRAALLGGVGEASVRQARKSSVRNGAAGAVVTETEEGFSVACAHMSGSVQRESLARCAESLRCRELVEE